MRAVLQNIGEGDDYRVPGLAVLRSAATATWLQTAAIVVEVVSPDDESWAKLPFYAAHAVDEVLIVDPRNRSVHWLHLAGDTYMAIERSMLGVTPGELAAQIDWPPIDE